MSNCSFADNEAGEIGGPVFIVSGFVDVIDSEFDGNSAGGPLVVSVLLLQFTSIDMPPGCLIRPANAWS